MVWDFGTNGRSNFSFRHTTTMKKAGINIGWDDMLMNYTHPNDMVINGGTPWQRAREKDPRFFQMLLDATTIEGDLVLDYTASTSE